MNTKKQNWKPLVISGYIFGSFWTLVFLYFHIVGEFGPTMDTRLVEVHTCLSDRIYAPVDHFSSDKERVYLCGFVSGTTKFMGNFYVYQYGKLVHHDSFKVWAGQFFVPFLEQKDLVPGEYSVSIGKGCCARHEITFTVIRIDSWKH